MDHPTRPARTAPRKQATLCKHTIAGSDFKRLIDLAKAHSLIHGYPAIVAFTDHNKAYHYGLTADGIRSLEFVAKKEHKRKREDTPRGSCSA